jgi:hypothetical protein
MASMLKQAQLPKLPRQATREQVLALIQALGEVHDQEDEEMLEEALEFLQTPLRSAAKLDFSQAEMERLCETWLRLGQQDLRTRYARTALKRWPATPVFVFHQIHASQDFILDLSAQELRQLETAHQRAHAAGDMRTAHRIAELLDAGMPFLPPDDAPFDPFDFDTDVPRLPPGKELERFIDSLLRGNGPPVIEEMKRELGLEGARQMLRGILSGHFDVGAMDDILDNLAQPKGRKRPRRKTPDTDPEQFDLF